MTEARPRGRDHAPSGDPADALPAVFGPYVLLARLGEGGAGAAYLARALDPARRLPSPLVIKRIHARLEEDEQQLRRFRHEAQVAVQVDSPHVARVHDAGSVEGQGAYIALEYVAGWTFAQLLSRLGAEGRLLPLGIAVELVGQALLGLDAIHRATDPEGRPLEVVHRDVSGRNVMVGDDGRVRLIDLGLGKSRAQDWRTAAGRVMGSPGYMSPEQRNGGAVDQRSDLYAMGVLLFELLTGQRWVKPGPALDMLRAAVARPAIAPSSVRPGISPTLDEAVARATAAAPEQRYASASEMYGALRAAGGGVSSRAVAATLEGLLGEDAAARRDETARLLSLPAPVEEPEAAPRTVVYARRPTPAAALEPVTLAPTRVGDARAAGAELELAPTRVGDARSAGAALELAATRVASRPEPVPATGARGVPGPLAVALGVAALALVGALVAAVVSRDPRVEVRTGPAAVPAVMPRAPSVAPSVAPTVMPSEPPAGTLDRAEPSPQPPRAPRAPSPPVEAPPPPEAPPTAAPRSPVAAVSVGALDTRARALRASLLEDDPRRAPLDRLLGRLTLARAAAGTARGDQQLERLAAELEALERAAP